MKADLDQFNTDSNSILDQFNTDAILLKTDSLHVNLTNFTNDNTNNDDEIKIPIFNKKIANTPRKTKSAVDLSKFRGNKENKNIVTRTKFNEDQVFKFFN